jgi:hypothetical protein
VNNQGCAESLAKGDNDDMSQIGFAFLLSGARTDGVLLGNQQRSPHFNKSQISTNRE